VLIQNVLSAWKLTANDGIQQANVFHSGAPKAELVSLYQCNFMYFSCFPGLC